MKYPKLSAFFGLAVLNIQSGFFGQKAHARLDEEQLQKLEDHMAQESGENLQTQLTALQEKYDALVTSNTNLQTEKEGLQNAVTAAIELNGLTTEVTADTTPSQAVELLGTKCKEYGASNNRHSFTKNDGKEKEEKEDPSASYEHNQVMTDKSKFKTIL
ncbi:hypothetical protein [Chryseobacterium sp. YIM B08800]|uniref:hypothetical protein n=1 Tax=Chryseobacterium sp. YIM B08800 TaxID=2984136 RepID=UPI00223FE8A1|nr:hypothetical protein [Chryseobacterium sp. YIM B08800]